MNGSSPGPLPDSRVSPSRLSLDDPETCRPDPSARTPSYFSSRSLARVDSLLLEELKALAARDGTGARVSLHGHPSEILHEMLILQRRDGFFPPKRHPTKAKSFVIVEGRLLVVVFEATGKVFDAQVLDRENALSYRVDAGWFHADIPVTVTTIHLEYTLGPFAGPGDREMAPWAPLIGDVASGAAFRDRLFIQLGIDKS